MKTQKIIQGTLITLATITAGFFAYAIITPGDQLSSNRTEPILGKPTSQVQVIETEQTNEDAYKEFRKQNPAELSHQNGTINRNYFWVNHYDETSFKADGTPIYGKSSEIEYSVLFFCPENKTPTLDEYNQILQDALSRHPAIPQKVVYGFAMLNGQTNLTNPGLEETLLYGLNEPAGFFQEVAGVHGKTADSTGFNTALEFVKEVATNGCYK